MIITNAHRINNGELPYLNKKGGDFFFDNRESNEEILSTILDLVNRRLPLLILSGIKQEIFKFFLLLGKEY